MKKIFGELKNPIISLHQFFTTLLIKKDRGIWPDDVLATIKVKTLKGATSILAKAGADKSGAIVCRYQHALCCFT